MKKYYKTECKFPIGKLTLCATKDALVGVWIMGQKYFCDTVSETIKKDDLKIFDDAKKWLQEYFKGNKPKINDLKLAPIGNDFRQRVWEIICEIPYGETLTYGEIAEIIANEKGIKRMSAQAVGGAIGHNPISIIIPCHRVVGKTGNLTGYAGGLDVKKYLLKLENANIKY